MDTIETIKEKLDAVTTCCICTGVFDSPKVLPCNHTFCMECLRMTGVKKNRGPGDEMSCPMCRREFKIPLDGFHLLPSDYSLERLIQVGNSKVSCSLCSQENKEHDGAEISKTCAYCIDCKYELCEGCYSEHRQLKFAKNHKLLETNHNDDDNVMTYPAQSVCEFHNQKLSDVFCSECRAVICATCFTEKHENHTSTHANKFVDDSWKQIKSYIQVANECRFIIHMKKADFLEGMKNIRQWGTILEWDDHVADLGLIVKTKMFTDTNAMYLLQGQCQSKLEEIQMATHDADAYLLCLRVYNSDCKTIMADGSARDLCSALPNLSVRAMELKRRCQAMLEREVPSLNSSLRRSEIEEYIMKEILDNLIGRNEDKVPPVFEAPKKFCVYKRDEQYDTSLDWQIEARSESYAHTLYDLPLELMDMILQKSYMHWIFNSKTKQRDEEVIRSLMSVDDCFYRRITRKRIKKTCWRYLKDFYGKTKKRYAIIRNNRNYLIENIHPNHLLISSLLSLKCLTEEQAHLIERQRSKRNKNDIMLIIVRSFDDTNFSKFIKCLRQENQNTVARLMESGGGVIKLVVQKRGAKFAKSMETKLQQNKLKLRLHQIDEHTNQLSQEGIEILDSQMKNQTVAFWIWCHSQAALQYIQRLYGWNQLPGILFNTANFEPSSSTVISIERNQFRKTIVVSAISMKFTHRIVMPGNELLRGVTKLVNKIYVLRHVIHVFEDRYPFRPLNVIEIKEIKSPGDICSSEKENCLYVSDLSKKCVWKITKDCDGEHKTVNWLTTDYFPSTLSVSRDGQLLMVNVLSSSLMIYGSDAKRIRSIQLPRYTEIPIHAVETSIGNYIILHEWVEKGERGEIWAGEGMQVTKRGIYELTRDGKVVSKRFVPSYERELNSPQYMSLDSDDGVFVADRGNGGGLITLDCDLKRNRIRRPKQKHEEIRNPLRLCYDEEWKQLIVGGPLEEVNVCTLCRN